MVCGQKKRFAVRCITRDRCPNRTLIKPEGSSPAYANVCACVRFLFSSVVGWSIASSAVCCALHFCFFLGLFLIIIISVKCVCFLFFVFAVVDVVVVYPLCVIVCECTQCILAGFRTNTLIAVLVYVILLTKKKKCYPVFCEPVFLCSRHLSYVYACVHIRAFIQNRIFRKLSIIPDTTPISIVQLWKLMENVPDQQTTLTVTTDQPDSISNAIHPKQFDLICLFINGVHEKCHSCNCTLHVISREI